MVQEKIKLNKDALSIDRINPDKDYIYNNCRFLEFANNLKRRKSKNYGYK